MRVLLLIPGRFTLLTLAVSSCANLGCAGGAADATGTAAEDPLCVDAVPVTWDNFGHGFLAMHCHACHAAGTIDRLGAPEDATFDTVEQAWDWRDEILTVATGDSPTEPPSGGVSDIDRMHLYWWLGCGTPGT